MGTRCERAMAVDLRVGCCGLPISLAGYAKEFRLVEVQQTFYQPPRGRTLEKWRREVPQEFEFTIKAWQLITHEASSPTYRRLREKLDEDQKREAGAFRLNTTAMTAFERTLECARILSSKVILFQCPARFVPNPEHKSNLRAFFTEIRAGLQEHKAGQDLTFVWEPRGEWKAEEVEELCEELSLVRGIDPLSQPPAPSVSGPVRQLSPGAPTSLGPAQGGLRSPQNSAVGTPALPRGLGYFRLHGRGGYNYRYTDGDLAQLLEAARHRHTCYVLFNNVFMLEDARRFLKL